MGKTDKIKEQNERIKKIELIRKIAYIEKYFSDVHHYKFLSNLNVCLFEYENYICWNIENVLCNLFNTKWQDAEWRKKKFKHHDSLITQVESEEIGKSYQSQMQLFHDNYLKKQKQLEDRMKLRLSHKRQMDILERIRDEIGKQGYTREKLGRISGLGTSKVKKYAGGTKSQPANVQWEDLLALAEALHCTAYYLMGETKDRMDNGIRLEGELKLEFAVDFSGIVPKLETLVNYLLKDEEELAEDLFLITTILDEEDVKYFIDLVSMLSRFGDKTGI